jgi:hypothetical protein
MERSYLDLVLGPFFLFFFPPPLMRYGFLSIPDNKHNNITPDLVDFCLGLEGFGSVCKLE